MRFYNSLTRRVEPFHPEKKIVGMYTCGPTVYGYAHIGNLRTFLFEDFLRRTLVRAGFRVKHVMNITDVGHLVSDADDGEDKMMKAARQERKTAWDVALFYTKAFVADTKALGILPPTTMPRATAHIKEQIALIAALEKKGHTYRTPDGIYFDTGTFPAYGRLSGQKLGEKAGGKRVSDEGKRRPADFALWKFSPEHGAKRDMEWKSPWGVGFPGWHIECSAMARKYLGQPFDIHCGGIDHLPVHHENEIAQSEAAYGSLLARLWMHGEFLVLSDEKMSKSKGNTITVQTLRDRNFDPLDYRYFVMTAHYRTPLTFTWDALLSARQARLHLLAQIRGWKKPKGVLPEVQAAFMEAWEDDLDAPKALAVLWDMVKSSADTAKKAGTLVWMDAIFGLDLKKYIGAPVKVPRAVQTLLKQREVARAKKAWKESDRVRGEIAEAGFHVEDTPTGQVVSEILAEPDVS